MIARQPLRILPTLAVAITLMGYASAQKQRSVTKPLSDFQRLVRAAHKDKDRSYSDKFAGTTVDQSMAGRTFRVAFAVGNGETTGSDRPKGSAFFTYADGLLGLRASTETARGDLDGIAYLKVDEQRDASRSYEGSNAYGARTSVKVIDLKQDSLFILNSDTESMVKVLSENSASQEKSDGKYNMAISIDGPEARKVAYDIDLVVEGSFSVIKSGKLTGCWTNYREPTFDNPTELYVQNCGVGATVSAISFVRRSSGMVLKKWTFIPN